MNIKNEQEFGISRYWKIFMLVMSPAMLGISIFGIIDCYHKEYLYSIFYAGIPILVLSVFTFITPIITKMRCGKGYIEKIGYGSKRVFYRDVEKVEVADDYIVIKSQKSKISITIEFDRQKEIIGIVLDNLMDNQNFKIKGSKKNKLKYFPDRS